MKTFKRTQLWAVLILCTLTISMISCKEDEATINTYIEGSWKVDSTQTVYNGGLLAKYFNINSDSVGEMVTPAFEGCRLTFSANKSGTISLPYMDLELTDTYAVSKGKVTLTIPKLASKQVSLGVTSINANQMVTTMSITDFTTIVSAVDTTATSNVDLIAMMQSMVPALSKLNDKISQLDFTSLGLNPTPTVTLVFNKQ